MILSSAILASSLVAGQAIGNPTIFGPDTQTPKEIRTESVLTCARDTATIKYVSRPTGGDRITSASVNRRSVQKADIDSINADISSSKIAKIRWQECPSNKQGGSSIKVYLEIEVPEGHRFFVLLLDRNGVLTRGR